jgi:hypothetical protein
MRRWLPLLAIAGFFVGLNLLLAEYKAALGFWQVAIFAALIVVLTARNDKNSSMRGCMTILSLLFAPFLALLMALIELLAMWSALDPIVGWAGFIRLPALLAMTGSALALIVAVGRRLRSKQRLRFPDVIGDFLLGLIIASIVGVVSSIAGFIWLGIGYGLSWAGL